MEIELPVVASLVQMFGSALVIPSKAYQLAPRKRQPSLPGNFPDLDRQIPIIIAADSRVNRDVRQQRWAMFF